MEMFLYIDVNILALIMIFSVFLIAYFKLDKNDATNRLFFLISFIIIIELIIESLTIVIDGWMNPWVRPTTIVLHNILYILGPGVCFFWCMFIVKWIESDGKKINSKVFQGFLYLPYIVTVIFVLLSNFFDGIFIIDDLNRYARGDYFIYTVISAYYYLALSIYVIIGKRREMHRRTYLSFIAFSIIPALGGLIQSLFYGVFLYWSCMAIALIIVFILIQQRMMQFDALTDVWTKNTFENYIEYRVSREKHETDFGVIFIDLDGFKGINDKYGHFEGDIALKNTVRLLRKPLRETDIIARFGGDEFVILVDKVSYKNLEDIVLRMEEGFKNANILSKRGYALKYSIGYDIFDHKKYNINQFLKHVDYLMYKNKEAKRKAS